MAGLGGGYKRIHCIDTLRVFDIYYNKSVNQGVRGIAQYRVPMAYSKPWVLFLVLHKPGIVAQSLIAKVLDKGTLSEVQGHPGDI